MFFESFGEDEDIVHIYDDLAAGDKVLENAIHHSLERGRGVHESKEHNQGFEKASIGFKGAFPLVTLFHPNIVIPSAQIDFREDMRFLEFIDKLGNQGKGILVLDSVLIEFAIILYRVQCSVLLFNEEKGTHHWRFGGSDVPFLKVFVQKLVKLNLFFVREWIGFASLWLEVGFEINGVIPFGISWETFGCAFVKDSEIGMIGRWNTLIEWTLILSRFGSFRKLLSLVNVARREMSGGSEGSRGRG